MFSDIKDITIDIDLNEVKAGDLLVVDIFNVKINYIKLKPFSLTEIIDEIKEIKEDIIEVKKSMTDKVLNCNYLLNEDKNNFCCSDNDILKNLIDNFSNCSIKMHEDDDIESEKKDEFSDISINPSSSSTKNKDYNVIIDIEDCNETQKLELDTEKNENDIIHIDTEKINNAINEIKSETEKKVISIIEEEKIEKSNDLNNKISEEVKSTKQNKKGRGRGAKK